LAEWKLALLLKHTEKTRIQNSSIIITVCSLGAESWNQAFRIRMSK
jgi:hypothetical protein